ncbi:related to Transcription factor tau 131 kDa subunit [Saccharomycodes ludwigii]|uniref:Related to Transcription factor tau 131 kDa subunit n=1 Tax=Saccharomycodes ludwigii TaxID=36035 RepID=A0A376B1B3_9ASCO|nr:related to Transcription factor tau 131 kDa subunit [Saccharomycodes ludwigii]
MSSSDEEALYDDLDDYRVLIDPHGSENDDAINNNDDDDDDDDDNDDDDGFNYIDDFEGMDPDEIDLLAEFSDINSDEQSNPDGKRKKKEKKKKMKESGKYNDNFKYSESEQESTDGEDEEQNFMNAIREANNFKVKTKKKSGGTGYRRVKTVDPEIAMLLSEANEAYVRNDIQVAENLYNEVIKKDAKNFAAYKTLGDIYQIQGRLNDCCNSWFLAAHLNSSDWEFWKVVGSLSNELNHKRQALYCYSRALSVNPNDAQCIYERALLYKTIGQLGRALESFQKLHKIYPYDGDILRELAVIYVDYDKIDEAIELYLKILKQNIEKRKIIRNYMENALDSSSEDEDTDSAEETDNEYDDSEDQEFNELPKKLRNKYRCIPFDWSSLNILAELYLKWAPTDPLHAIRNIKRCARWIQYRESQTFWDDVSNDSEFDERRQKNAKFQALGDFKNDFEYFLPIDIRIRLGLLRLASKNIPEGLVHFNFLFVENFEDIADLFFEVGVALTKLEEYKHAVDFFEPLWDFPGYSTLEYYKPLAKCYRELEKYEEAKNVYSKIVEMRPGDLESKLTLAEMYYHLANLNMFNKLLLEVVQARKRQKEQDGENEKKDNNEVGSDVVDNNNLPIGDVSSTAKPLMTDDKPLFNAINAKKKKKLKGVDMEKYRKEREQKIAASVIDRYKKLKIYKLGMNKNDENQLMLWIDTASDLVDIFTSVRNFFVKNRSKKFVGIIKRARKFNKLLDYKIERLSKLSMGENLIDGMPITEERIQLISTTELRGLKYDEWFELFMELALIVTKYQSIEDGLSIIETAQDINVFHQDPNRNKMMKFVKFSIVLQMEDGLEMIENLRVLLNQFQFNRKLYQIFMFSLAGGGNMAVDIISSTLEQKFFLRQIKAFDSIRFNTHVSGQASISNKAVEENLECLPSAYLYYIYAMLLYSSRGFLSSLQYLSRIEKQVSDDPMFNLMMGLSYIHRSMQRLTPNRHFQILHGFRYLYQYYDLKANSNDTIDKQEASYNIGRSFHLLGLLTPAVKYYYEVLDSKFKDRRLKKHAAYNLVLIFNESGNTRLSSWLIEHYLYV